MHRVWILYKWETNNKLGREFWNIVYKLEHGVQMSNNIYSEYLWIEWALDSSSLDDEESKSNGCRTATHWALDARCKLAMELHTSDPLEFPTLLVVHWALPPCTLKSNWSSKISNNVSRYTQQSHWRPIDGMMREYCRKCDAMGSAENRVQWLYLSMDMIPKATGCYHGWDRERRFGRSYFSCKSRLIRSYC